MTKQYAITETTCNCFISWIKALRYGSLSDGTKAEKTMIDILQSLPELTGEPVAYLSYYFIEPEMHADPIEGFDIAESTDGGAFPVYTHAQPVQDPIAFEALDELLGQYWDAAYKEGKTGMPQSTEANNILHKLRQLVKSLQPEPEDDGSDWFAMLRFICRVLGQDHAPKEDWQTAYGMARSLQRERWQAEKQMQPLTAEDVTDEMEREFDADCTINNDLVANIIASAYNAVVKGRTK